MKDTGFIRTAQVLLQATHLKAVFGELPPGDTITKRSWLRKQFTYLAQIVHPDHAGDSTEAANAFKRLNDLRRIAEDAIKSGTYDNPLRDAAAATAPKTQFSTGSKSYSVEETEIAVGTFSTLYRGVSDDKQQVVIKVALEPVLNTWLESEAALLKHISERSAPDPVVRIQRFLPQLLETCVVMGNARERYRVLVLNSVPDLVSVADIIAAYPKGLDAPQAAWVARRIFAQTLAAEMLQRVHCAITPAHVLVDPFKHEPLHIGWVHAQKPGSVITQVIDEYRGLYPPEVFAKKPVDHAVDVYMAAATVVLLMGGDVKKKALPTTCPQAVADIVLRCLAEDPRKRPHGADTLERFTKAVRNEWGRKYRALAMPIR